MSGYTKAATAKATIAESRAVASAAAYPAIVGTRFALILSVIALAVSGVALAVAVSR